jgi:hypothetical protein
MSDVKNVIIAGPAAPNSVPINLPTEQVPSMFAGGVLMKLRCGTLCLAKQDVV